RGGPDAYAGDVEAPQDLPDVPQNAALLDFLRGQASTPGGPDDYTLGAWQLHTHPDLIAELRELAPGWPLTDAYGVPLLANEGIGQQVGLDETFAVISPAEQAG